jgi:hypothetical protein
MSSKLEELEVSHEEAVDKTTTACCANCGIAEVDDVVLEECGACKLVRYCSDKCREEHRDKHEEECKKWHDEVLFTQPNGSSTATAQSVCCHCRLISLKHY